VLLRLHCPSCSGDRSTSISSCDGRPCPSKELVNGVGTPGLREPRGAACQGAFSVICFIYFIVATPSNAPLYRHFVVFLISFGILSFGRPLQLVPRALPVPLIVVNLRVFIRCAVIAPHIGAALYTVCGIIDCPPEEYARESIPFMVAVLLELAILVFLPGVVLWIPNMILGG
jgi:hypothetical protein